MSDTVKKPRRWPWIVLAAVLLLICGPIAWRTRPLNATERRLVGHWRCKDRDLMLSLAANRRFQMAEIPVNALPLEGRWTATASSLIIVPDAAPETPLLTRAYSLASHLLSPVSTSLRWHGPDQITVFADVHVRVPPEEAARSSIHYPVE